MTESTTKRMDNPAVLLGALPGLQAVSAAIAAAGVPAQTLELVHLRASQVNECSFCVDMAGTALLGLGASPQRVVAVAAWRESAQFDRAERAALATAEEATRLAGPGGLTTATWEELVACYPEDQVAAILLQVALVGLWNSLNDAVRQPPGGW